MAYQSKAILTAKIQALITRAENVLNLGDVRSYNNRSRLCFDVEITNLKSVEDMVDSLPIPVSVSSVFQTECDWIYDAFVENVRENVLE